MSDTVMENGDLFQPQPTNRQIGLGLNEKDEIVMLQSLVQEQREQLRVRDVENLELRDTIKQLQALQISNTLQIERIDQNNKRADQLLQKAIECGLTQNLATKFPLGPSLCSPPKPNLSSKAVSGNGAYKVSSSVSHSRNKSTVSSSAGTATTSSSAAGNPKEVRRRIGELEGKVKSILKTLKGNQNTSHGARLDEMKPKLRAAKENEDFINRDSGIVMGDSPRTSLAS